MRKWITAITLICLIISTFTGCSQKPVETNAQTQPVAHSLKVGYGRVDITPQESVPLRGYGNTSDRMSNEVTDPIYATCIAFTDENDSTVLLFHNDLIGCPGDIMILARKDISDATGIPASNIMVSGTHMHSGPDLTNLEEDSIPRYNKSLRQFRSILYSI